MEMIARTDQKFVAQLGNISAKAPTVQTVLNLTAAELTALAADYNAVQAAVLDVLAKQTAAQSATQAKNATLAGAEKRLRAFAKRVKGNVNYTPAIGELLGIVASSTSIGTSVRALTSEVSVRPQLKGSVNGDGAVALKFAKKGFTGVMIYSRRGDEKEFTFMAKQLTSPLVDDRANLAQGLPETREYRAQFFKNDTTVGQMSDILVLTVPAGGVVEGTGQVQTPVLKAA
jgi:hypothetical protein